MGGRRATVTSPMPPTRSSRTPTPATCATPDEHGRGAADCSTASPTTTSTTASPRCGCATGCWRTAARTRRRAVTGRCPREPGRGANRAGRNALLRLRRRRASDDRTARPAGAAAARGGRRLPPARGEAVLVGALRPAQSARRRVDGPRRHAASSTVTLEADVAQEHGRAAHATPASCASTGHLGTGQRPARRRQGVRALRRTARRTRLTGEHRAPRVDAERRDRLGVDRAVERRDVAVEELLPTAATRTTALPMALGPGRPVLGDGAVADAIASRCRRVMAASICRRLPAHRRGRPPAPHPAAHPRPRRRSPGPTTTTPPSDHRRAPRPRRLLPRRAGPARHRQDVHRRAAWSRRWWRSTAGRIGVVAQSHAVVENMLRRHRTTPGLPAAASAKKAQDEHPDDAGCGRRSHEPEYAVRVPSAAAERLRHRRHHVGLHQPRTGSRAGSLDLLVIDEAGQFCSGQHDRGLDGAPRNLLLLGDPQQLPQVSQGTHPEPVDRSALGWLADGHGALPAELGYFLARTWRMHPALCAAGVATCPTRTAAFARSRRPPHGPSTACEPGLRTVLVDHVGNAVASPEEARGVVDRCGTCSARSGPTAPNARTRPLGQADILVVAPVQRAGRTSAGADAGGLDRRPRRHRRQVPGAGGGGRPGVHAASAADDVPRGMAFLLSRNRLNVAHLPRQWCAVIVRSRRF